jgi:3-dehydroshikimate dehydratase
MILPGLVSVTFRQLEPAAIVDLCVLAGLSAVEWGADMHVPPGSFRVAEGVRRLCESRSIDVVSYGSYYRLGQDPGSFEAVLRTAREVGAPSIRVWAGSVGFDGASDELKRCVSDDVLRIAELASAVGVGIAVEHHVGTLADRAATALMLPEHPNVSLYWQPSRHVPVASRLDELASLSSRLSHVHVFHWLPGAAGETDRRPLAEGEEEWCAYLALLATLPGDHATLLEFVPEDSPEQFLADAKTLLRWLDDPP